MDGIPDFEESNILFFNRVFPERYDFDTLFTNQLLDSLRESDCDFVPEQEVEEFDKIPAKFTSADEWPRATNLRCLNCNRLFKTRPLTMITHIANEGHVIKEMTPFGFMCSGDCVATYIDSHVADEKTRWSRHKMFSIFYRKLTGITISSFSRAHEPWELELYGGDVSMDDHIKSLKYIVIANV